MPEENKDQITKITITLPTNAYFMSGIRDFTLNMIKSTTNFEEKWAFRFQSVIDELCNNAIEYGSAPGSDIRVTFAHKADDYIEMIVEDTGTGSKPDNAAKIRELYLEKKKPDYVFNGIRGRGLVKIVGEWSDELEFTDRPGGGISVRVRKYLKNQRSNAPSNSLQIPQIALQD